MFVESSYVEEVSGLPKVPGDKSISHRALIIGASAVGISTIHGLLEGDDVLATADALKKLGVRLQKNKNKTWTVYGCGVGGLSEPKEVLNLENSGTGARLLMGLVASHPFRTIFVGDKSLSHRPMARVVDPLTKMGANFSSSDGIKLPITVHGSDLLWPVKETLVVASAQVKSAILLAGLNIRGQTTVVEPVLTRDHTENMLVSFGANVSSRDTKEGNVITLEGFPELTGQEITIPGDFSSAAFLLVAALLCPGAGVKIENVCLNPLRTGLLKILKQMGGKIETNGTKILCGERVGTISAKFSNLKGGRVTSSQVPSMIDEFPILAMAAACADGETYFEGAYELRLKESDRISTIAEGLKACGVEIEETKDGLVIKGRGVPPKGGCKISTQKDHRIAMAFLILGMVAKNPITIDDAAMVSTSFPKFMETLNGLGGRLRVVGNNDI